MACTPRNVRKTPPEQQYKLPQSARERLNARLYPVGKFYRGGQAARRRRCTNRDRDRILAELTLEVPGAVTVHHSQRVSWPPPKALSRQLFTLFLAAK
jgi:hypothetical protein